MIAENWYIIGFSKYWADTMVDFFLLIVANSGGGESTLSLADQAKGWVSFGAESIILIVGVVAIIVFFFRNKFETFKAIKLMAKTTNAFMTKIMQDILQGLEKKQITKEGTLSEWTKIVVSEM